MCQTNLPGINPKRGREHVKVYAEFMHGIQRLYQAAKQPSEGDYHEQRQVPTTMLISHVQRWNELN
jgi:hypothetical protein